MRKIAAPIVLALALQGCHKQEAGVSRTATWQDGKAKFELSVSGGEDAGPFVAKISIRNVSGSSLTFPTPFVMPLCGETNKNNIRVSDENGRRLEMTGAHGDFASRPITQIPADAQRQWTFTLDDSFPGLKEKGRYEVRLWYFSDQHDPASWKGRVDMDPVVIVRG